MGHPQKLSGEFVGALRTFGYWVANGSLGCGILNGIDYKSAMLVEPSLMEGALAVFANVLEFNESGVPINAKWAERRAAQYIRQYCERGYVAEPPIETWEVELFGPPPRADTKPWPNGAEA